MNALLVQSTPHMSTLIPDVVSGAVTPASPIASGGTVTISGGYVYHTFTASGTFTVYQAGTAEYLVVAGGGGGARGGGGGGGVVTGSAAMVAGAQTVTIGTGGTTGVIGVSRGTNGTNSVLGAVTATGGGGGGTGGAGGAAVATGGNGGSGGGGGVSGTDVLHGNGTVGQGSDGGDGIAVSPFGGGGGGGASATGQTAPSGSVAGNGGAGVAWNGTTYGGGGGGGLNGSGTAGTGGAGGGGNGNNAGTGSNGTANTGGGGGGGQNSGGTGGSGIVIVRYPLVTTNYATGGTVTSDSQYIIHTFITSSTFALAQAGLLAVDYAVVGGGGGGSTGTFGSKYGGGGAGGVVRTGSTNIVANQTVTIGPGGGGGASGGGGAAGTAGTTSSLGSLVTATGGGGGSGGTGGSNADFAGVGGLGGLDGGGGAGAGANASTFNGGNGAAALGTTYGGGGGGVNGTGPAGGTGGTGGGGNSNMPSAPSNGTANTGGGGGGTSTSFTGGNGGSGVVIVRYSPGAFDLSYGGVIRYQSATSYWPLQTARTVGQTETDAIDSIGMVMTSGDVPALSAGDGPLGGYAATTDKGVTFAAADTELMLASVSFDTRQNWSVSGWWRTPSALSGTGPVLFTLDGTDGTHSIFLIHRDDRGGLVVQLAAGGAAVYLDPGSIQLGDNAWHHIAFTRAYSATSSADTWTFYYDGVQQVQTTSSVLGVTPSSFSGSVANWSIDALPTNALNFSGDTAHVVVAVGTTWSPSQVAAQYAKST